MRNRIYERLISASAEKLKQLAILVDPDKFEISQTEGFLKKIPADTTHIFVGGSTVDLGKTAEIVYDLKANTKLPIILFPGDYTQISQNADGILFLSLLSGNNPEYLIHQQVKSIAKILNTSLEVLPTAYLLIDGGQQSAVARVSQTEALSQDEVEKIVHIALAGQYMGAKLVYLEAGSGALYPVSSEIIKAVKDAIKIPLIVGGGIRSMSQKSEAYSAGADMVVMGTVYESNFS